MGQKATLYENITDKELPHLLRCCYDESGEDMGKTADSLDAIDTMLGVLKARSLISSRERRAKSMWTRERNLSVILGEIIHSKIVNTTKD